MVEPDTPRTAWSGWPSGLHHDLGLAQESVHSQAGDPVAVLDEDQALLRTALRRSPRSRRREHRRTRR